ncbi:hypothetical protein GCM10009678_76310 [Actinomadura kijaniata]|uniref:Capsular polysaccharide biosynthesis protein n=1 Tax=Actinomadura namibiensis TaxID=182080 RepID=A0A7W3M090_ACTNM|nr:hypothetical protein [Actinomadura namibiensis]MBA8957619.1 capsular polysaccharide biosynthesis protein [Actinomadura namibiensis]
MATGVIGERRSATADRPAARTATRAEDRVLERAGDDALPLARYLDFLRRQWPVIAAALAVGAVLGLVRTAALVPPTYTATVAVLAPPVPLHPGLRSGSPLSVPGQNAASQRKPRDSTMDTETQFVYSDEVLARLGTFPGFEVGHQRLRERIAMRVPENTRVLTIMVTGPTPTTARDGADIVAEAYLTLREEILGGIQQRNREGLQRRLDLLKRQLAAMPGNPAELTRLTVRTRRQQVQRDIAEVQKQLGQLDGTAIQPGEVVRGATVPREADDPGHEVSVTTGAGLGMLAGVAVGLVRQRRPRRLRTAAAIRAALSVPVLAQVGGPGGLRRGRRDDWREAGRRLRNVVNQRGARTVALTGVPGPVAAQPAHRLALACVESGATVTLLRLGVPAGDLPSPDGRYLVKAVSNLDAERVLTAELDAACREADVVIAVGTALTGAQTLAVAMACDLTVLAVDAEHALDRDLGAGVGALVKVGAAPAGVVLIAPEPQVPPGSRRGSLLRRGRGERQRHE